jgi:hypothetical protein
MMTVGSVQRRFQVKLVLREARAQETPGAVACAAQDGPVRRPDHDGGARKEYPMSKPHHRSHRRRSAGAQREQQLRLESHMRKLVRDELATKDP